MSENEKKMRWWAPWVPVFLASLILVGVIVWTAYDFGLANAERGWPESAQRGDFLGGYAGLTSLAGTLMLFSAFLLQARELRLQMEELKENRKVAKQQATALETQAEALTAQHDELEEQNRIARLRDDRNLILQMSGRVTPTVGGTNMRNRVSVHAFEFIVERASHDSVTATALLELFVATANWKRHPPFQSLDVAMRKLNAASLCNWMPGLNAAITNMFSRELWHEDFGHSISRYEEAEAEAVLDAAGEAGGAGIAGETRNK